MLTDFFNIADDPSLQPRCPMCGQPTSQCMMRRLKDDHDARMARLYVEGLERWDGLSPADQDITRREGINSD